MILGRQTVNDVAERVIDFFAESLLVTQQKIKTRLAVQYTTILFQHTFFVSIVSPKISQTIVAKRFLRKLYILYTNKQMGVAAFIELTVLLLSQLLYSWLFVEKVSVARKLQK